MEMKKEKLKNISLNIGSGMTPLRSNSEYWNSKDIPWVKTELLGNYKIYDANEYISQKAFEDNHLTIYPKNTLSIAMYGEGKTRGNVSIFERPMTTNQACCNIVIDTKKADYRYVYYAIKNSYEDLRALSSGVRKNLNSDQIKNFEIPFCSLFTQQKIAAVLSSLDDKIALNNRINAKLEQMAKRLYDYWFVQFDFPNADDKPYKSTGGKMVWNEELKREIPEGWEVKKLGEILILLKDGTHNPPKRQEKGIPLLTGTMFGNNFLDYDKATYISEADYKIIHSQYEPHENDVIITKIGTLGNVNLLRNIDIPLAIHCNSALLRFDMALGVYYPFSYCKSDLFKMRLKAIKGQSIQEFASLDRISSIKSEVPCVDIINKFDKIVKPIIGKQKSISFENKKLKEMRDKLLPLLMNGQVVVE